MSEKIVIKHRYSGAVFFEHQQTADQQASGIAMRAALEAATKDGAYLVGADLVGANLVCAYLDGANLRGAYLDGANLVGANLRGANLDGANMVGANLRGAYLDGANLRGANLRGANLRGANLRGANLRGANMVGANLGDKKLIGKRPILMIGPIGSRSDYFTAYMTDAGVYLRTGCFFGSVDKFRAALKGEHGDSEHAHEYAAALELIACHARLWAPEVEATQTDREAA